MPEVGDAKGGVVDAHSRCNMYCVKPGRPNVVARSSAFVCTTQMDDASDTSTATHVAACKHRDWQLASDMR